MSPLCCYVLYIDESVMGYVGSGIISEAYCNKSLTITGRSNDQEWAFLCGSSISGPFDNAVQPIKRAVCIGKVLTIFVAGKCTAKKLVRGRPWVISEVDHRECQNTYLLFNFLFRFLLLLTTYYIVRGYAKIYANQLDGRSLQSSR